MVKNADLEIVLSWREDERLDVGLAFDDPVDMGDRREPGDEPIWIDTDALRRLAYDAPKYGTTLAGYLFASSTVREFYTKAKAVAHARAIPLRVRISIDPKAPARIQEVRWETLIDPEDDDPIALRRDLRFSRYLSGAGWDVIAPPRKRDIRALVVIANPNDLGVYAPRGTPLPPIDVAAETARAGVALAGVECTVLASGGRATLENIANELDRGVDILYLVCHGALIDGEPILYLEASDGAGLSASGIELAKRIHELHRKPSLAVICSCQSAGVGDLARSGDDGALTSLGPRLARAGVAAVIAMQANVQMSTAGRFLESFFTEFGRDGVVDRAVAVARGSVRDQPDWWVPVLFSRLKRGQTYYSAGFAERADVAWNALVGAIRDGVCTPVLGPGLAESLLGSRARLAESWVRRWLLPIAAPHDSDLTTVGQYVRAGGARYTAHQEIASYLVTALQDDHRYQDLDPKLFNHKDPDGLIKALGERARAADPAEPHTIMASLDLPVYITTSWTDLLTEALEARGRRPSLQQFDWNAIGDSTPRAGFKEPTAEEPLVFHLFGRIDKPESLVLTEDDYFQWLVAWVEKRHELVAPRIIRALTRQSLMFVGYRLDDWDFRVLFQSLKTFRGGQTLLRDRQHVGVQLDPTVPGVEPEAAQEYVESYFNEDSVKIYWGPTDEFLNDLERRRRTP